MLTFDPVAHQYFWNGQPVVNVTRVLGPLTDYSHIPPDVLERAREQGVAVHKMVELDCKNDLDVEGLPEWMRGHYNAWRQFKADTDFECWDSEAKIYHEGLGYAGTPDLVGIMRNSPGSGADLLDVKRSFYGGPVIGLQMAAYAEAWNRKNGKTAPLKITRRFALRLDGDGKYRLLPFEDRNDFAVFTAQLALYRWKEKYGKPH